MLIEFSVENYRSIQKRQTLSMVASEDKAMLENNTFSTPNLSDKLRLITSAVIYGANASGKSNLLRGMQTLKRLVVDSASRMQAGDKLPVESFRLNSKYKNQPTSFFIIFIHQDIRFEYGVILTKERVYEEWLIAYPNERPQNWFSRKYLVENSEINNNQQYKWSFGKALKGEKERIKKLVRSNSLFLSHAAQNNHAQLTQIFEWFQSEINILTSNSIVEAFTLRICNEDDIFRQQVVNLLSEADIGISDLKIEHKSISDREKSLFKQFLMKQVLENQEFEGDIDIEQLQSLDVKTMHQMNDSEQEVEFEMEEESDGTQRLFQLAGLWLYVLQHGEILIVDELGRSLHPVLTKSLIKMFNNPDINQKNAQIIFTIHDTTLLDTELFRQDQIWFTEKEKSATKLYSLLDFMTRNDESLQKGYLLGRYGAVPFIHGLNNINHAEKR
ncbi:ATP-binding protein [Plectonema cf. radiosum LEGE 06105]|uniref:ATP-binding protein n=1 Tax=Plectonema cf. radiosum LEGE 06105 TaxID=945769 RepID=A0A8J7K2U3_9CYAN|nr:ATP-binding protein [Plectonema radiosum]MBE9214717.1 ATP-binding protein [Plectonema cf. radiosum LEGE 06105]